MGYLWQKSPARVLTSTIDFKRMQSNRFKKYGALGLTVRDHGNFIIQILNFPKVLTNKNVILNIAYKKTIYALCNTIKSILLLSTPIFLLNFLWSSKDFMEVLKLTEIPKSQKDFALIFSFKQLETWTNSETFDNEVTDL